MADQGLIGAGIVLSIQCFRPGALYNGIGTGIDTPIRCFKFGLVYENIGTGTVFGTYATQRATLPTNVACSILNLGYASVTNPFMLKPNEGTRTFVLKTAAGGTVVAGAKVTISEHHSQEKLYPGFRITDSAGSITFKNLNTASVYTVVAVHPTLNSYNAARFDWIVPNSS